MIICVLIYVAVVPKRVPKSQQPPPRPLNAYLLFFTKLVQTKKDDLKSSADTQVVAKQAAATWKGLTLAEKQVIYVAIFGCVVLNRL